MGTSATGEQLASKLVGFGTQLPTINSRAISEAALAAKAVMLSDVARAGASSLSGVGRSGSRIGVGYDVKGGINATAIVSYRGQAHLANNPTRAHEITPRAGRRGRQGKRALSTPNGAYARVQHPGTRGKKFFEDSQPKVAAQTPRIFNREVNRGLRSVF